MRPTDVYCKNCFHWYDEDYDPGSSGICRRMPPTMQPLIDPEEGNSCLGLWPVTAFDEHCGEWKINKWEPKKDGWKKTGIDEKIKNWKTSGFDIRVWRACIRLGLTTLREITDTPASEFLRCRQFGQSSLASLRRDLAAKGLTLYGEGVP